MSKKLLKKADRKQRKSKHMLLKETGIEGSDHPTKFLMVGNAGLLTGLKQEQLLELCLPYGQIQNILMLPGKSYCFVVYEDVLDSTNAYNALHGKVKLYPSDLRPIYFAYIKNVPSVNNEHIIDTKPPPGLVILEDFVSEEEENILLNCIDWDGCDQSLKHRRVTHYGYEFRYDTNNVNKNTPLARGIPKECDFIMNRFKEQNIQLETSNQLTVNQYQPGQGIPSHIDTHSAFDGSILSLSLGSDVVMDFKHSDGRNVPIQLLRRSLLVMSEESRYAWSHGITPRTMDVVSMVGSGLTVQLRDTRTSFTFRIVRRGECDCAYTQHCDSYLRTAIENAKDRDVIDNDAADVIEATHVHQVYEEIATHFSDTRHKPWPHVLEFVESLHCSELLVDVGCGNGKYFGMNKNIFELGCDRSFGLAKVCKERGYQVFNCNCLAMPLKDNIADGCISIAVIHHLATKLRRLQALQEIVRILRPGGKALIYVWAKDQVRHKAKSTYLKQDRKNRRESLNDNIVVADTTVNVASTSDQISSLHVHTNRTTFQYQDVLVPWKVKPTKSKHRISTIDVNKTKAIETSGGEIPTFLRYYHVFEEGELEKLLYDLKQVKIVRSFYDQGNWCVIFSKSDIV